MGESEELTSWNRFRTRNLGVAPELLGQAHVFTFDGHGIAISLPSDESLPADAKQGEGFIGDRLSVNSWQRAQDGGLQIRRVDVHNVDVVVDIPGRTAVPEEALNRPIRADQLFSEQQQKHLDKLASKYGNIARRAFDLWIRTMRWKADDSRIGVPEVRDAETGWGTRIREKTTQKDVWAETQIFVVPAESIVTIEVWNEVSATLDSGHYPSIYCDLLYDAMAHLERGDLQRAVVDAAVAAETYMRTIVQQGFPDDLDASLQEYINEANIRPVFKKLFPAHLDTPQNKIPKALNSNLHKLFDDRNKIMHFMHSGQKKAITAQDCHKYIRTVRALISLPLKS
jgi:hypothetical protein